MSVNSNNLLTQQLPFQEIYDITIGSITSRYTSWSRDVEVAGNTYEASGITRSGFKVDTNMGKVIVNIQATLGIPELVQYAANVPIEKTSITISRLVEDDDTDIITIFSGLVSTVTFQGRAVSARCEANSLLLDHIYPDYVYQSICNHGLFDEKCNLNENSYKVTSTVATISGSTINISGLNASGHRFTRGKLRYGNDYRMITYHFMDFISLHIPFDSTFGVGSTVTASPGCDKQRETCQNTYNNYTRFHGHVQIPIQNPVRYGV